MTVIRGCSFPDDLAYDDELNLWFRACGDAVWDVGITEFGLARSGEIYMFNPRPVGRDVEAGRAFALIEVAKTVLAVRAPFDCVIEQVNEPLAERPAPINRDPFGNWLCRLRASKPEIANAALLCGEMVAAQAIRLMELNRFDGPEADDPAAKS